MIGDLTTAEKYAAMPKTMQLTAKSSGIQWKKISAADRTEHEHRQEDAARHARAKADHREEELCQEQQSEKGQRVVRHDERIDEATATAEDLWQQEAQDAGAEERHERTVARRHLLVEVL